MKTGILAAILAAKTVTLDMRLVAIGLLIAGMLKGMKDADILMIDAKDLF